MINGYRGFGWLISSWLLVAVAAHAGTTPSLFMQSLQSPPSWVLPGATYDIDFENQRYWFSGNNSGIDNWWTYTRTGSETCTTVGGLLYYAAANVPCINDNGFQSWEAITNLILQSQFAASWTASHSTLTANAVASPDTTTNAATLIEDATATTTHLASQNVTKAASALAYTVSVYAKSTTRRVDLQIDDNAGNGAVFVCDPVNQAAGVAGAGVGTAFTTITSGADVIGSWTRCWMNATSNTATTIRGAAFLDNGSGTAAQSATYSGDGTSGANLFGFQLERNAFVGPGPYVPTTAASASLSANSNSITTAAPTVSASMYGFAVPMTGIADATTAELLYWDDGTNTNRLGLRRTGSTGLHSFVMIPTSGGYAVNVGSAVARGATFKSLSSNTANIQKLNPNNSSSLSTQSITTIPPGMTKINIGQSSVNASQWHGYIKRVALWSDIFYSDWANVPQ